MRFHIHRLAYEEAVQLPLLLPKSVAKQEGKKRRRPAKKLVAAERIGDLRDALPDVDGEDDEWEGFEDEEMTEGGLPKKRRRRAGDGQGKMVMRSLKHRPGAMKRKHQLHQREVERFGRNLAQLAGNARPDEAGSVVVEPGGGVPAAAVDGGGKDGGQGGKWAALRNFISMTMERDPAFAVR